MAIAAKDVQALRQRTGLGMMDCKKALEETDGDPDAAMDLLRKRLKGKMDERTDRAAAEGQIAVAKSGDGSAIAMIELNAETDFAAKNEQFMKSASEIAQFALEAEGENQEVQPTTQMTEVVDQLRISIKENIQVRRAAKLVGGKLGDYVHHNGKIGVIVQCEGEVDEQTLTGLCQHIAAHVPTPQAIDEDDLPQEARDKAMSDAKQEALDSGKPEEIAEKIATGKYKKWVDENTLLGQVHVKEMETKKTVGQVLGDGVKVKRFFRYGVGG